MSKILFKPINNHYDDNGVDTGCFYIHTSLQGKGGDQENNPGSTSKERNESDDVRLNVLDVGPTC